MTAENFIDNVTPSESYLIHELLLGGFLTHICQLMFIYLFDTPLFFLFFFKKGNYFMV